MREAGTTPGSPSTAAGSRSASPQTSLTAMRRFLDKTRPATASAGLNLLRLAFPRVSLKRRVKACDAYAVRFRLRAEKD